MPFLKLAVAAENWRLLTSFHFASGGEVAVFNSQVESSGESYTAVSMFRFLKREQKPAPERESTGLPHAESLSTETLLGVLRSTFEAQHKTVGALFLVAFENLPVYYAAFQRAAREDKTYPATMEGCASFLAADYAKITVTTEKDEVNRRRRFYLYLAALLNIAHTRAEREPGLWDRVAAVWIALLPGAQSLRETIEKTALWTPAETEFFSDVKTEHDGLRYCISLMAPREVRYHNAVNTWLEKDLPPDVRESL